MTAGTATPSSSARGSNRATPSAAGFPYTGFAYRALKVADRGECVELQVSVTNTGARAAEHVVLAFAHPPGEPQDTPARLLKAFCAGGARTGRQSPCHPHHPQIGAQPVRRGEPELASRQGKLPFFRSAIPRRQSSCEGSRS